MNFPSLHVPVLIQETLHYWVSDPKGLYVDLTLGLGGHSLELLKTHPKARLIALDWDQESLELARERLKPYTDRITFVNRNFADIAEVLRSLNISQMDGFLFDLGPSSYQILHAGRGLSYQKDDPLDMRMSQNLLPFPAKTLLEKIGSEELAQIFKELGEISPSAAHKLAKGICQAASRGRINTSAELARVIQETGLYHRKFLAQAFQAIRIVVNSEIENLKKMLAALWPALAPHGRVVGISFHSLEDRVVKRAFLEQATLGRARILTKKPARPTPEEIRSNPPSRSAKLRAVQLI